MRHLRNHFGVFLNMDRFFQPVTLMLATSLLAFPPVHAAPAAGWDTYTDMSGFYSVRYPTSWQVLNKGNALVITSPGGPEDRGVFGITPRAQGNTINASVDQEFNDPEHSPDLKKAPARIAGVPAIKVWGSKKGNPNIRVVEYYVQSGNQQYYILFQAPHSALVRYSPVFERMIASMQFLK